MLPDGWKKTDLEDLMIPKHGIKRGPFGGALKKEIFVESGYKVYEQRTPIYKDFSLGKYYIDEDKYKELNGFAIKAGDLLVSCSGTIGKIVQVPPQFQEGVINQALLRLRLEPDVNQDYFLHVFESDYFQKVITDTTQGGAMKNMIGMSEFRKVKIPMPPANEQAEIADVLNASDRSIEKLSNLIAIKQKQKKALMQRLLTGKHRFSEFEGQEWQEVELGDIFKEVKTKVGEKEVMPHSITAGTGFVSHAEKWGKDISGKQYENYTLLKKGQFAYNKGNSKKYACGCMYLLRHENEIAVPNVFISYERRKDNVCNEFYEQYFIADYCARELKRHITSGARSDGLLNLSKKNFFTIKVPLPPKVEQQKIATVLNTADKEIDLLTQKLEAYQDQKKGLMQQLLTGKKRVKIAEKEKAVA